MLQARVISTQPDLAAVMAGDRGRGGGGRGSGRGRGTPNRGTPQQGRGAHAGFSPAPDFNTPNSSGRGRGRGRGRNSGGVTSSSPWFQGDSSTPASAARDGGGRGGGRFAPQQQQQRHSSAAAQVSSISGTAAIDAGDRDLLLISRDAKMNHVWEVRMGHCRMQAHGAVSCMQVWCSRDTAHRCTSGMAGSGLHVPQ